MALSRKLLQIHWSSLPSRNRVSRRTGSLYGDKIVSFRQFYGSQNWLLFGRPILGAYDTYNRQNSRNLPLRAAGRPGRSLLLESAFSGSSPPNVKI